jgi:hypothetical protein
LIDSAAARAPSSISGNAKLAACNWLTTSNLIGALPLPDELLPPEPPLLPQPAAAIRALATASPTAGRKILMCAPSS